MRRLLSRPAVLAVVAVLVLGAVAGGAYAWVTAGRRADDDALRRAVERLAASWQGGRLADVVWAPADAGRAEVAPDQEAAAVTAGLTDADADLPTTVEVAGVDREGREAAATARLRVTWSLDAVTPAHAWSYDTRAALTRADDGTWQVRWAPSLVHPDLADGETLSTARLRPTRGDVLGAGGTALVTARPVVFVEFRAADAPDPAASARRLAALVGVDAEGLVQRVRAAAAGTTLPVITLRQAAYEAVRTRVEAVPGAKAAAGTLPLAPSATFARALLGSVGEATAEIVEASQGRVRAGDTTGLSGLQRTYDERLAGTAGLRVTVRPAEGSGGEPRTLTEVAPVAGEDVTTTLDQRTQAAAEAALAQAPNPAGLVAVRVSTGEVLAAANGPADAAGFNRALTGQYPPGSTFKIVSTYALLEAGLDPAQPVACPPSLTVLGKAFTNYEDEAWGAAPFTRSFALSCNTAFVGLRDRISHDDLVAAAGALGVGAPESLGVASFTGSVPTTDDEVEQAADMIGQGKVLASPLTMAVVSASVASGSYRAPTLVADPAPAGAGAAPRPLDPDAAAALRGLMRQVVTSGTGSVLAGVPGGPVSAKTGTAEYGPQSPPQTHAWLTGVQGDVAWAAVVEDGESGAQTAGPLVADFLSRLAG